MQAYREKAGLKGRDTQECIQACLLMQAGKAKDSWVRSDSALALTSYFMSIETLNGLIAKSSVVTEERAADHSHLFGPVSVSTGDLAIKRIRAGTSRINTRHVPRRLPVTRASW